MGLGRLFGLVSLVSSFSLFYQPRSSAEENREKCVFYEPNEYLPIHKICDINGDGLVDKVKMVGGPKDYPCNARVYFKTINDKSSPEECNFSSLDWSRFQAIFALYAIPVCPTEERNSRCA